MRRTMGAACRLLLFLVAMIVFRTGQRAGAAVSSGAIRPAWSGSGGGIMRRAMSMFGIAVALLLAGLAPASAQDVSVRLMTVPEEQISDATLEQIRAAFSDERARLGVRLQALQPDQTPRSEERRVGKGCRSRLAPYH